jgi:hypothetical protein
MKKNVLSLSIASAIALAGAIPASYADDECDGVLVQSRFALANCMIESAVAIAAAAATENGCAVGEWDIEVIVPELITRLIPLQGTTYITNEGGDIVELTGQSSALEKNNVNCRVATTTSGNVFDGKSLTYSPGFNNFYVDAIVDRDSNMLCISDSVSSGDIELGNDDFDETNDLSFEMEDGLITAEGTITISESRGGGGGQGSGQGPGGPDPEDLSIWDVEEEALIPPVGETADEGFELEAETDEIEDGCKIEVEASIENLASWVVEGETGGLTISGELSVEPEEED